MWVQGPKYVGYSFFCIKHISSKLAQKQSNLDSQHCNHGTVSHHVIMAYILYCLSPILDDVFYTNCILYIYIFIYLRGCRRNTKRDRAPICCYSTSICSHWGWVGRAEDGNRELSLSLRSMTRTQALEPSVLLPRVYTGEKLKSGVGAGTLSEVLGYRMCIS